MTVNYANKCNLILGKHGHLGYTTSRLAKIVAFNGVILTTMQDFLDWLASPPPAEPAPLPRFSERGLKCLLHRLLARQQITRNQFEVGLKFLRLRQAAEGSSASLVARAVWNPDWLRQPPPGEFEHPIERAVDARARLYRVANQLKPKSLKVITAILDSNTTLDAERDHHITRERVPLFAARALDELDDIFNGRPNHGKAAQVRTYAKH